MSWTRKCPELLAGIVIAFLLYSLPCNAAYNAQFCATLQGEEQNSMPDFYDDFSALTERSVFEEGTLSTGHIVHHTLRFSSHHEQASVSEETNAGEFWTFFDQKSNGCRFKRNDGRCAFEVGTCSDIAKQVRVGLNGAIDLGSAPSFLGYPSRGVLKKQLNLGRGNVRNINTVKFGTCAYLSDTDETVTSVYHFLRPDEYSNLPHDKKTLLMIFNRFRKPGGRVTSERIDFTHFRMLSLDQILYGLQVAESQCGNSISSSRTQDLPRPSSRHSFVQETILSEPKPQRVVRDTTLHVNYDSDSQVYVAKSDRPLNDLNEKEERYSVVDYAVKHNYQYSQTNGSCTVKVAKYRHRPPEIFWDLEYPNATYMGVYSNREIPCDLWKFDNPYDGVHQGYSLYLATSGWLSSQGRAADAFYPVETIHQGPHIGVFMSFFEFQDQPAYAIPYMPECFDEGDIFIARLTILLNYERYIAQGQSDFSYEFGAMMRTITGISSRIRIGAIQPQPSDTSDSETVVSFRIFGKFKRIKASDDEIYSTDPITSEDAVKKINAQVNTGRLAYVFNDRNVAVNFKKGSFFAVQSGNRFAHWGGDSGKTLKGYSPGAVAGVAIAMLIVGLASGVAFVFGYKRWTEHGRPGLSFSMNRLSETG